MKNKLINNNTVLVFATNDGLEILILNACLCYLYGVPVVTYRGKQIGCLPQFQLF